MAKTLYLIQSKAHFPYNCTGCGKRISSGSRYFRHDPNPFARIHRGEKRTHWCVTCLAELPESQVGGFKGRLRVPLVGMPGQTEFDFSQPLQVRWLMLGQEFRDHLIDDPSLIYTLSPNQFEEFVCERLFAMGMEPRRTGRTNQKDGGIDVIFWPRRSSFPFLGAAQVKHHRDSRKRERSPTVRNFVGAIANQPFQTGLIVTNTSFTADAKWFAQKQSGLVRLRDMTDIRRWLYDNFDYPAEWREIPDSITLCPGMTLKIR